MSERTTPYNTGIKIIATTTATIISNRQSSGLIPTKQLLDCGMANHLDAHYRVAFIDTRDTFDMDNENAVNIFRHGDHTKLFRRRLAAHITTQIVHLSVLRGGASSSAYSTCASLNNSIRNSISRDFSGT
jgi:hypothetical protein